MRNIIFFIIAVALFFVLAVFQSSFLPHMLNSFVVPNLVFILFFVILFSRVQVHYLWGIAYAVTAGLFIDVFSLASSTSYLGPAIIACLAAWGITLLLHYFLQERQGDYLLAYFALVFSVALATYAAVLFAVHYLFAGQWIFGDSQLLLTIFWHELIAIAIFSIARLFIPEDRQLSLL